MKTIDQLRRENVLMCDHEIDYLKSRILKTYDSCLDDELIMDNFSEMREYVQLFKNAKEDPYTNIGYISVNNRMGFRPLRRMISFLEGLH